MDVGNAIGNAGGAGFDFMSWYVDYINVIWSRLSSHFWFILTCCSKLYCPLLFISTNEKVYGYSGGIKALLHWGFLDNGRVCLRYY